MFSSGWQSRVLQRALSSETGLKMLTKSCSCFIGTHGLYSPTVVELESGLGMVSLPRPADKQRTVSAGGREEFHTDPANLASPWNKPCYFAVGNHESRSNLGTLELRDQQTGLGLVESGELTVSTGAKPESPEAFLGLIRRGGLRMLF